MWHRFGQAIHPKPRPAHPVYSNVVPNGDEKVSGITCTGPYMVAAGRPDPVEKGWSRLVELTFDCSLRTIYVVESVWPQATNPQLFPFVTSQRKATMHRYSIPPPHHNVIIRPRQLMIKRLPLGCA